GDEQRLQAPIASKMPDGVFQDFEFAALQADAVEQNGAEDHPPDGEEAEGGAVGDAAGEHSQGHVVDACGHYGSSAETGQRRHPGGLAEHAQQHEQGENRNGSKEGRERQTIGDGCIGLLPHGGVSTVVSTTLSTAVSTLDALLFPAPERLAQFALDYLAGAGL